jgi:type IV pilus assembly protein PilW
MRRTESAGWSHRHQQGHSLVELMMALGLGLILLTLVTRLTLETRQGMESLTARGEEREAGRYALSLFREDLRLAGFLGTLYLKPALPATLPDACANNLDGMLAGLSLPIQVDDRPATASRCVDGAVAGVERLVIRHAATHGFALDAGADDDDGDGDRDDLDYGRVYLQGFDSRYVLGYCSRSGTCTGLTNCADTACHTLLAADSPRSVSGDEPTVFGLRYHDTLYPVELRAYQVRIYYLRNWSATVGDGIPTLVRADLQDKGSAPGFSTSPLLDAVARIGFDYGLNGERPSRPQDWAAVTAVRVFLLVRSRNTLPYNDTPRQFNLGGTTPYTIPADKVGYRHQRLTALISLDNNGRATSLSGANNDSTHNAPRF